MISLFIVESPFQLISAIEAKSNFCISDSLLVIRYSLDKKNNIQLKKLVGLVKWKAVIEVESTFSIFDSNIKLLYLLLKLKSCDYDHVFIGEYRSWVHRSFFCNLESSGYYLLDDGAASLSIFKEYVIGDKIFEYGAKFDALLLFLCKVKKIETHCDVSFKFFSSFDIPIEYAVKNNFQFIKEKMMNPNILDNTTYFFGAPLAELGILSIETEMSLIKSISDSYMEKNRSFIYISHRRESDKKLNKIKSVLDIEIFEFEFPAEIELVFRNEKPESIASFYSTVLQTLPAIYSFKAVTAYKIPLHEINLKFQKSISGVYQEYDNSNVTDVMDVN